MWRSSTATEHYMKTSDVVVGYVPLPMLTPAPTPTRTLLDNGAGQAGPPPRLQRSLTTGGATRGQMSPWAHYNSDQQQRVGVPPPLLLLDSARLRNVSPYHLSQRSPAAAAGERRTPTAQYSSQFLARSLAASPASSWAQSPQRSLSRRQSIVLQSSCSGHLSIESPSRDYHRGGPLLAAATAAATIDPQSMASTKSLPHGPPNPAADAQRSRRRSMAYERYPPLVSIFEASAALSLAYDDAEPYGEEENEVQAGPNINCGGSDDQIVRRSPSSSSLASAFSVLSSSSSSSSASSYSYLFGAGRPSAAAISSGEHQTARKFNANRARPSLSYCAGALDRHNNQRPSVTASILLSSAGDFSFGTMTDAAAARPPQQLPLSASDGDLLFPSEHAPLLGGDSSATLSTDSDWRQHQSTSSLMVREAGSLVHASSYLVLGNLLQA
ncbi:hypothetical protein GGF44_003918, partial [Coemansia sp. RSA 1694]